MSRHRAVGIHVFAGGFSMGVKRVFDVQCQLERHGFGVETAEQVAGVPVVNHSEAVWPDVDAELCYGNPRCTAFSTITSGYRSCTHGPWARQCEDIRDLVTYGIGRYPIVIFESVQQAFSTGRPLLDWIRDELCKPKGYRVCHVLVSAQAFDNPQRRRRYFFVAYRDDRPFNIEPPRLRHYYMTNWDVMWPLVDRPARPVPGSSTEYDGDCYMRMNEDDAEVVKRLPNGWDYNRMGRFACGDLPPRLQATWKLRISDMPFSLHCPYRLQWLRPSPTLYSTCHNLVHPWHPRFVTYGELAAMMGWPRVPVGRGPVPQMVKGLVPNVGEWIAQQAAYYLDGVWGQDDFESRYDHREGRWDGNDARGQLEKTFQLTEYVPRGFDIERYPPEVRVPRYPRPGVENT